MPTELETQLAEYGAWLAAAHHLDVCPPSRSADARLDHLVPPAPTAPNRRAAGTPRPIRRRHRLVVWTAAVASAAALVVGLIVVAGPDAGPSSEDAQGSIVEPVGADAIVDVATVMSVSEPLGEVLWRGGVGTGVGELGVEPCDDCEPLRPWAPVALADGSLLVADQFNQRWILVDDGVATGTFTGDWVIEAQPIVAGARVFAIGRPTFGGADVGHSLLEYDPARLTVPARADEVAVDDSVPIAFGLVGRSLLVDEEPVDRVEVGADRADLEVLAGPDASSATLETIVDGRRRQWRFPAGWAVTMPGGNVHSLADGTVFVVATDPADPDDPLLVELTPSGAAYGYRGVRSDAWNGELWVDDAGVVVLEIDGSTFRVVRYPLVPAVGATTVTAAPVTGTPAAEGGTVAAALSEVEACQALDGAPTGDAIDLFNLGGSCVAVDGTVVTPGQVDFSPCNDGSSLWWNDVGYGFTTEDSSGTWSASADGLPGEVWAHCSAPG